MSALPEIVSGRLPQHGSSGLSAENRAFLALLCRQYRATHDLTQAEAAARAGADIGTWKHVEANKTPCLFGIDCGAARIIHLVLRVSPICRKGESPHIPETQGADNDRQTEARPRQAAAEICRHVQDQRRDVGG